MVKPKRQNQTTAWQWPAWWPPGGGSELRSYFRRLWTKVHRIKFACAGVSVVCNAVFRLTMSCCFLDIFAINWRSCAKSGRNFDPFGPPNFGGGGPKFLTDFFINFGHYRMWQSLVMIGQATSEIRRRKKEERKKEDLNYNSKAEWPAASISWRAAIKCH